MLYGMQGMSSDVPRCVQCWYASIAGQLQGAAEGSERAMPLWLSNLNNLEKFIPFPEVGWLRSGETLEAL
jgi:hypothetical protein